MSTSIPTVSNTSLVTDTDEVSKLLMMPWITSTSTNNCPYPPTPTDDLIDEHDRPYSKYGHLSKNQFSDKLNIFYHYYL